MESEQSQNFNERLSQWVANQGFWFQVRYSMSGSGIKGPAMFHLLRLGFRLLVFLLLVAVGIWVYLVKRTESQAIQRGLARRSCKSGFPRPRSRCGGSTASRGSLKSSRLAAEGGDETFFTALEARNIRCKMGLLDGVVGKWEPGHRFPSPDWTWTCAPEPTTRNPRSKLAEALVPEVDEGAGEYL